MSLLRPAAAVLPVQVHGEKGGEEGTVGEERIWHGSSMLDPPFLWPPAPHYALSPSLFCSSPFPIILSASESRNSLDGGAGWDSANLPAHALGSMLTHAVGAPFCDGLYDSQCCLNSITIIGLQS